MAASGIYRNINADDFPRHMEISFFDEEQRQTLVYEKVTWAIDGDNRGLRYGENPDQQAALYRPINGNLRLGEVQCIAPGRFLASDIELLQAGKHPGKINVTDADSALNILRYLSDRPATVIVKHNNPSGVAVAGTLAESYRRAYLADRIAAFGGVVAVNRELDLETAGHIGSSYSEVVVAPEYAEGTIDLLSRRKNLRIMKIAALDRLHEYRAERVVEFDTLIDGGIVAQWSQVPQVASPDDYALSESVHKGRTHRILREPRPAERLDMHFGWLVLFGVTSNSVIYVKNETTVGIGTGEQDRVGVAEIARDKAYRKYADRLAWEGTGKPLHELDTRQRNGIEEEARAAHGDLEGSIMVSDAFFPFRDGVDVGIREGVTGIVQPGGSIRDWEVIDACNESDVTMVFTGQRNFRH
ncbi:MAG: IMP cyclohydrolase [Spirochaetaceae bacterium]|nr:IMP cyclohydrolase [Spirochaetaceae bacterium]